MIKKTTTTMILKNILFSLRVSHWEFSPGLIPSLATLVLLPMLIALGCWQWQRAIFKQDLLDQFAERSRQPPQVLNHDAPNFTPIQVTGTYDTQHLILLDNRIVNHQAGYDVLAPFNPEQGDKAILINLGWIPKNLRSSLSANAFLKKDKITLIGLAQKPQNNWVLSHPQEQLEWPLLVEDLQFTELSKKLNRPLYSFILLLNGDGGFIHHWNIVVSVTPERHRAYAVQWFALTLTVLVLYIKLNLRKIS